MKKILGLIICGVLVLGITGCGNNENNDENIGTKKDRVSGSNYKVYGMNVNVPTQYANKWVINDLKVKFLGGNYTISYCIDDIYTTDNCDISKHSGKGTYTIEEDKLLLNITESTVTDVELDETETKKVNTVRTCKIVESDQVIIDCKDDGGFIYFSNRVDDNYYKKSDCDVFNGKTYAGDAYVSGYYLRNGQWISDPTTFTVKFTFKNDKLESTSNGVFKDDSCEKISDTSYKIGQRSAVYDPTTDTFKITIGTVNGIKYGTMDFITENNRLEPVDYPEISGGWLCNGDDCEFQNSVSFEDMKKFADDNGLIMKIIYESTSPQIPNGTVNNYCDETHSSDDFCVVVKKDGKKAMMGDTFIISVERH